MIGPPSGPMQRIMRGFQVLLVLFWSAGWSTAAAQQPEGLDALYSGAMEAFAAAK